jgi:anaerobic magnesium-protoporphyrin IX monomethyl ester cyclase
MRIHFVAADLEENIGVGILAAVVEGRGHSAHVVAFNDASETAAVTARAVAGAPDVIGLSIQFQHRAPEFLALARELRAAGYRGHITCGGQFPTLAWREALAPEHGVDSIVLHDAEETIVDLLAALEGGTALGDIPGLALRADDGAAFRTGARRLLDDLDAVPFARRYRPHDRHMDVPFIPIVGGRGCWGKCSYCSIISFYDDAIEAGGGRAVRLRSPENIADEMALLLEAAGGRGIFCFHDDNFVFPSEKLSIKRVRSIREALDAYGVGKVALVGKARPDCITPALARELAALGVIRLYVGVENGSEAGGEHLRRGTQQEHIRVALSACRDAGIFVCYNLLVFEPGATVSDVRENVHFIREHASHPINFCRAEPYFGTALHTELARSQDLGGSYLGFNYRIADDRTELLFRICSAAFRERNFAPNGVANRYMGLGYAANILRRFHDDPARTEALGRRATELTRSISLDTAAHLERAIDLAEGTAWGDRETIERETALLGLSIAAADRRWHEELDAIFADMQALMVQIREAAPVRVEPSPSFFRLKGTMAMSFSLAVTISGCRKDAMVVDPPPPDMTFDSGAPLLPVPPTTPPMVVDPPPPDMMMVPPPDTSQPVDAGRDGGRRDAGAPGRKKDGSASVDPGSLGVPEEERGPRRLRLIDQWFDTSPKATARTVDLPLYDPPRPRLSARREGQEIVVRVEAVHGFSTRWEADGDIRGDGAEVRWRPADAYDRVRVAIRSRGGVAVLSLRAGEAG